MDPNWCYYRKIGDNVTTVQVHSLKPKKLMGRKTKGKMDFLMDKSDLKIKFNGSNWPI